MVATVIVLLFWGLTNSIREKFHRRHRYRVVGISILLCIATTSIYLEREQFVYGQKKEMNFEISDFMGDIQFISLKIETGNDLKHRVEKGLELVPPEYRSYHSSSQQIADYIYEMVNVETMNNEQLNIFYNKIDQLIEDYKVFLSKEGIKCYCGIYTPSGYEHGVKLWMQEEYKKLIAT